MSENQDFHNRSGMLAFIGSMVFVTLFFIYMVTIDKGVDLAENIEVPLSDDAPAYNLAAEPEPWVSNPEIILAGAKVYRQACALCHGANGDLVGSSVPTARNLVEGAWTQGGGLINHFKVLQNGIPGTQMASFSAQLTANERWAVIHFIETITNNKSQDNPEDVAEFAKAAK